MRLNNKANVLDARFRKSNERIAGNNGEINAGSKQELMSRLVELAQMVNSGEVASIEEANDSQELSSRSALLEAYHDGTAWTELGSSIAAEIDTRLEREGFMRTLFDRADVDQGSIPRIRVREPNVRAFIARGPTTIFPQTVRDKYITSDEFIVSANPRVDLIELQQGSPNLLEDKFFEGNEAIMVTEDRLVTSLLDASVSVYNEALYFTTLSPQVIQQSKYNVERWRLPARYMLMSLDLMNDIVAGNDFSTYFEPISKLEIIMTGRLGRIFNMEFITDGYREPSLQVLPNGTFYITSNPNLTGSYTDRGPVESRPVDAFEENTASKGWRMWETISTVLANGKAVQKSSKS